MHAQVELRQKLRPPMALTIEGVLTAMYYGSVAERRGQKLVLLLSTIGYIAMLALDLIICKDSVAVSLSLWLTSLL